MNNLISNDNKNFVYRCEIRKFSFKLKDFLDNLKKVKMVNCSHKNLRKVYENYQSGV